MPIGMIVACDNHCEGPDKESVTKKDDWVGRQTVATSGRWSLFSLLVLEEKRDTSEYQRTVWTPPHLRHTALLVFLVSIVNLTYRYGIQSQKKCQKKKYYLFLI